MVGAGGGFQPTAEDVLGCCVAEKHRVTFARGVSTHSRGRPRLLPPPPRSPAPRSPKFQPTAEDVLGCCAEPNEAKGAYRSSFQPTAEDVLGCC